METVRVEHEGNSPRPRLGGSVAYLLLNLPIGVVGMSLLLALFSAGVGTVIVWAGLPILALALLLSRGAAKVERARIYAMLDTYIALPYRPLPEGTVAQRWKARVADGATWRDVAYFFLLFPIGVIEFCLTVTFWATSLSLLALPIYFRFLPGGAYHFPGYEVRWITVDSTLEALPWAALGVLAAALSVALTKALAATHARFARALLGPTRRSMRLAEAAEREDDLLGKALASGPEAREMGAGKPVTTW
ncbi:sensor domain-containing protein [Amycolatopsis suaedae]|uniref:Two-component system sensor kinase n=1 Tax=Amycolatopsis suaedae TaxID=2510978 RepID=A0A4Q7IZ14_9PSEU|nr:sensor domain-containing protein [Amycolatopsis suaedae]RZQ59303.1 two-component system sensor kinase [Amycolatopsis suaedae]